MAEVADALFMKIMKLEYCEQLSHVHRIRWLPWMFHGMFEGACQLQNLCCQCCEDLGILRTSPTNDMPTWQISRVV